MLDINGTRYRELKLIFYLCPIKKNFNKKNITNQILLKILIILVN